MFAWISLAVVLLLATAHVLLAEDRSPGNVGRIYLAYLLPLSVGVGGLIAFLGHAMRPDEIAQSIGCPLCGRTPSSDRFWDRF